MFYSSSNGRRTCSVFEKTLIGGFSGVTTRLAFDTQILISDKKNEKVLFDLDIDGKKANQKSCYKDIENGRE